MSGSRARALAAARRFALGLALIASIALASSAAADPPDRETSDAIHALVVRGHLPQLKHPDFTPYRPALEAFYRANGYAAQWLDPDAPWHAAVDELAAAPMHGLDAADYDVDWLRDESEAIAAGALAGERGPRADVALTVSLFRLLSDLHGGRVKPERAGFRFKGKETPLDLPALLRSGLEKGDLHDAVLSAEPSFPLYQRLEEALAYYLNLETEPLPAVPPLPRQVRKIEPGGTYAGVAAIAERLRRVGDLPEGAQLPPNNRYDGAIVDGVRSFQERHGLKPDGVLGRDTLAALSAPFARRVRQLELSLERLRWLPELPPGPVIAV